MPLDAPGTSRRAFHSSEKVTRRQVFDIRRLKCHEAIRNARALDRDFHEATPRQRQGLINVQSDGSRRGDYGGVANIFNICLPNGSKYTIEEAEPMDCHVNSFLAEAAGVMKACKAVKYILEDARLEEHTAVHVNVVTDCQSILSVLQKRNFGASDNAKRYEPIIREIDDLAADIVACTTRIRLKLFYCPRNKTETLHRADFLAARAVETNRSFKRRVDYIDSREARIETYNDFEHRTQSSIMRKLAPQLSETAQKYPIELETSQRAGSPQGRSRKRKRQTGDDTYTATHEVMHRKRTYEEHETDTSDNRASRPAEMVIRRRICERLKHFN